MSQKVFAFGTLKRGFPLHAEGLSGAVFVGDYKTRECYPMIIAGRWFAPMMFNEPGIGFHIIGELYAIDDKVLAKLDHMESVGIPGNFRVQIEVEPIDDGLKSSAFAS
jgi:gamma-glutamylaminecyclotransferase